MQHLSDFHDCYPTHMQKADSISRGGKTFIKLPPMNSQERSRLVRVAVSTILKECMKCSLSLQIIHETRREGEPLFLAIISLKRSTHNNSQRIFIPSSLEKKTLHHVVNSN